MYFVALWVNLAISLAVVENERYEFLNNSGSPHSLQGKLPQQASFGMSGIALRIGNRSSVPNRTTIKPYVFHVLGALLSDNRNQIGNIFVVSMLLSGEESEVTWLTVADNKKRHEGNKLRSSYNQV